jgi:DGQHR domain-containing protein
MKESFPGLVLQDDPPIFVACIPGRWLLQRVTPAWRIKDPVKGFQRSVSERRAREIAAAVLDQGRTFPNAIVLATDATTLVFADGHLSVASAVHFLVVDGQHRLYSQHFSDFDATYACMVHSGLSEERMAELFVEINDNQKRVPASLRWDLVRLVRPEDDPAGVRATDLVYDLATEESSPLYQRIDLTGEVAELELKQASLATEIRRLAAKKDSLFAGLEFAGQYCLLTDFFAAIRECDPRGWRRSKSNLYKNRVVRALLQLLPELLAASEKPPEVVRAEDFFRFLKRIDLKSLAPEAIVGQQGHAGIKAIYTIIKDQAF